MNSRRNFTLGVVEGFYGVFYTFPERVDLIRFLGQRGYNLYVYAPKNDRQHRARWWEAYPARIMAEFAETVKTAQDSGMDFCYGISPGETMCYSSAEDFARLTGKLNDFYQIGVRAFSLMLDDFELDFCHAADAQAYANPALAQADLANRLYAWLQALDPACTLSFVPGDYSGRAPFSASLQTLGERLDPAIDLCYTGPEVCSPEITAEDAHIFAQVARRKPLIWDNYPVNDLTMQPELHLGPVTGRAAGLPGAVRGILVNPMIQAEASKIPLLTYAAYAADPAGYDPAAAWDAAVTTVAGEAYAAPLRVLADHAVISCLGSAGQRLNDQSAKALAELQQGRADGPEIHALETCLTEMDEAGYTLKFRLENLALRNSLLPWIEIMEHWMWLTRFALRVLRAMEQGQPYQKELARVNEYIAAIRAHPKRIATDALMSLVDYVLTRVEQDQRQQIHKLSVDPDRLVA